MEDEENRFSVKLVYSHESHLGFERPNATQGPSESEIESQRNYLEAERFAERLEEEAKKHSSKVKKDINRIDTTGRAHHFDGGVDTLTIQSLLLAFASAPVLTIFIKSVKDVIVSLINKNNTVEIQVGKMKITAKNAKDLERALDALGRSESVNEAVKDTLKIKNEKPAVARKRASKSSPDHT